MTKETVPGGSGVPAWVPGGVEAALAPGVGFGSAIIEKGSRRKMTSAVAEILGMVERRANLKSC